MNIKLNTLKKDAGKWILSLEALKNDKYTDQKKLSKNTIKQYNTSMNDFIKYLEENQITEINKDVVLEYRAYLIDNFKPSTINVRIVSLNKFFYSLDLNELTVNKVENRQNFALDEIMTEEELQRFINKCYELDKDRLALLVETLVNTGIRIEELKFFTADNVNSDRNYFQVTNKGKTRNVYLTDSLKDKLQEYCIDNDINGNEVIFHGRDKHKLLNQPTIWKHLKQIAELAGINKKFNAHSFRHIYAKRMANNGMNIDMLANILGHNSIETTRIYTKNNANENLKAVTNILNLFI